jgi:hypothetical protein
MNQEGLFDIVSKEEFEASQPTKAEKKTRSKKVAKTEPRINTVWFALSHEMGFCTCPNHEEIQKLLNPEEKEYRQKYPVRMVYPITDDMWICRDCFIAEGDK